MCRPSEQTFLVSLFPTVKHSYGNGCAYRRIPVSFIASAAMFLFKFPAYPAVSLFFMGPSTFLFVEHTRTPDISVPSPVRRAYALRTMRFSASVPAVLALKAIVRFRRDPLR